MMLTPIRAKSVASGLWFVGWLASWLITASVARGELPVEQVQMARKATALVISGQGRESGWGASFCIAPGLFVTTDKVANTNEKLSLVLDAGEAEQRVVPAKVIRADAQLGFALLRADVGDSVPAGNWVRRKSWSRR